MEISLAHQTPQKQPWDRAFWKPVHGKEGVFAYLIVIHVLGVIGLILYPLPSLEVLGLMLLFTALGGLGTTVCYHRMLAHKTLRIDPFIEQLLIFCAVFNGSGHPASWVAYHRLHHAVTDQSEDISSPKQGGFWWAHLRWLYQTEPADKKRWAPELTTGIYRIWGWAETPIILLSLFVGLLLTFGWMGFFWIGAIRLVYSLHLQCLVNSLTHLGEAKEGTDSSINVWWLGPFQLTAWGENWHKNHHTHAGSARLGLRWYQPDIGWYFIWLLEAIGLAHSVKRPRVSSSASLCRLLQPKLVAVGHLDTMRHSSQSHVCPDCGSSAIFRVRRRGFVDWLLSFFGQRPFWCQDCNGKFHKGRTSRA